MPGGLRCRRSAGEMQAAGNRGQGETATGEGEGLTREVPKEIDTGGDQHMRICMYVATQVVTFGQKYGWS